MAVQHGGVEGWPQVELWIDSDQTAQPARDWRQHFLSLATRLLQLYSRRSQKTQAQHGTGGTTCDGTVDAWWRAGRLAWRLNQICIEEGGGRCHRNWKAGATAANKCTHLCFIQQHTQGPTGAARKSMVKVNCHHGHFNPLSRLIVAVPKASHCDPASTPVADQLGERTLSLSEDKKMFKFFPSSLKMTRQTIFLLKLQNISIFADYMSHSIFALVSLFFVYSSLFSHFCCCIFSPDFYSLILIFAHLSILISQAFWGLCVFCLLQLFSMVFSCTCTRCSHYHPMSLFIFYACTSLLN